ncbi:DMT family transporter [Candidatus Symbiopectobacterium sp. NZEC135]|uniref:DMT family transporter n=1 Tax=Candidatus Symbiopectobacterium sp. NZEC135 TaxID=2820471 RepID=UPI00222604A5|nr:DMT family transporter [Candidatus Symbiopectobacterium sp. NZEC135]MCW2480314.1 DMT family transporter [Candidatus Symbiopectobacterium sp. NZEC135]
MFIKGIVLSLFPAAIALVAGALLPFQVSSNAAVGKALGHPLWGALVSLIVSLLVLLPLLWFFKAPSPRLSNALEGPWWLWIGGVFGALYVVSSTALTPRLGAASFIVLVVAGQMITAILVDQFGLMGLAQRPVTLARIAGVILIVAGAVLIQHTGNGGGESKRLKLNTPDPEIRCQDSNPAPTSSPT